MRDHPGNGDFVTASWSVGDSDAFRYILFRARHHDLVVVGRTRRPHGLPEDFVERLLLGCGRPVLIAHSAPPRTLTGTVLVCWRETADAARAVAAATPLLAHAKRVIIATVAKDADANAAGIGDIVRQLAWSGVRAESTVIPLRSSSTSRALADAADDCAADLIVLGAYGHSRTHENSVRRLHPVFRA